MTMRIYRVTVGDPDGGARRELKVPSKTDVQASDAAVGLMKPGEAILDVMEIDDPYQQVDGPPPGTQTHPDRIT